MHCFGVVQIPHQSPSGSPAHSSPFALPMGNPRRALGFSSGELLSFWARCSSASNVTSCGEGMVIDGVAETSTETTDGLVNFPYGAILNCGIVSETFRPKLPVRWSGFRIQFCRDSMLGYCDPSIPVGESSIPKRTGDIPKEQTVRTLAVSGYSQVPKLPTQFGALSNSVEDWIH